MRLSATTDFYCQPESDTVTTFSYSSLFGKTVQLISAVDDENAIHAVVAVVSEQ